jgi:hypothetical protein
MCRIQWWGSARAAKRKVRREFAILYRSVGLGRAAGVPDRYRPIDPLPGEDSAVIHLTKLVIRSNHQRAHEMLYVQFVGGCACFSDWRAKYPLQRYPRAPPPDVPNLPDGTVPAKKKVHMKTEPAAV